MAVHLVAVQLIITAITAGLAIIGWRFRFRAGARPFVALTGVITVLSVTYAVLLANPDDPGLLWATITVRETVFPAIPLLWFVFALDYTGHSRLLTGRSLAGLAFVPLTTATVLWVPSLRWLYWGPQAIDVAAGVVEITPPLGPWYWVNLGYGYLLMLAGFLLLFGLLLSEKQLYTDQSVAIVIGALVPFGANVLLNLGVDPIPLPLQPLSFVVTGLAFGFALFRSELFSALPVTSQVGRNAAVEDIQEGILITDTSGQVVDVNPAASAIFDDRPATLVGTSVGSVFGDQAPAEAEAVAPTEYRTDAGRIYGVTVSSIHDRGDRPVGRAIVFRDITERELRETQLEVLNRVLRHNLRNKLSVVQIYAEMLGEHATGDAVEYVERQTVAISELMTLGDRAREFEELTMHGEASRSQVDISAVIRRLAEALTSEFPEAEVTMDIPSGLTVETYPDALEVVLENLLRNAAEHTDQAVPQIEITAASRNGVVRVAVRDYGPGIPDDELEVLEAGTETPLVHGSGLGLWISRWGVNALGGDLAFEANDPRGTTAIVTVP